MLGAIETPEIRLTSSAIEMTGAAGVTGDLLFQGTTLTVVLDVPLNGGSAQGPVWRLQLCFSTVITIDRTVSSLLTG